MKKIKEVFLLITILGLAKTEYNDGSYSSDKFGDFSGIVGNPTKCGWFHGIFENGTRKPLF